MLYFLVAIIYIVASAVFWFIISRFQELGGLVVFLLSLIPTVLAAIGNKTYGKALLDTPYRQRWAGVVGMIIMAVGTLIFIGLAWEPYKALWGSAAGFLNYALLVWLGLVGVILFITAGIGLFNIRNR